jgi:hypothetical protein
MVKGHPKTFVNLTLTHSHCTGSVFERTQAFLMQMLDHFIQSSGRDMTINHLVCHARIARIKGAVQPVEWEQQDAACVGRGLGLLCPPTAGGGCTFCLLGCDVHGHAEVSSSNEDFSHSSGSGADGFFSNVFASLTRRPSAETKNREKRQRCSRQAPRHFFFFSRSLAAVTLRGSLDQSDSAQTSATTQLQDQCKNHRAATLKMETAGEVDKPAQVPIDNDKNNHDDNESERKKRMTNTNRAALGFIQKRRGSMSSFPAALGQAEELFSHHWRLWRICI